MSRIAARLASQNLNKLAELRDALPAWEIEPLDAAGWPEETGETYWENALLKARFGRDRSGPELWILGEDSGIECDALGGEPGLHSARWAPGRDQADALLQRLAGEVNRQVRMVSFLVAMWPGEAGVGHVFSCGTGTLEGTLATAKRGLSGFGYDPIFIPHGYSETVAELGDEWKRKNSHRALAAKDLLVVIADHS